ncbi:MAG: hypothetical protein IPP69_10665 [Flavobacteriales bacterium]|nr:hypothetical protein [Flavobacteriales bacterium]
MKKTLFACLLFVSTFLQAQDEAVETGLPGDGFSLDGAISLFSTVKSPEEFEKALNAPDNGINNLDLNQDGDTDYLVVEDVAEGDGHAIAIRSLINDGETQDVAVIEIEKTGEKEAVLQIFGDEELYGEEAIAEPSDEKYFGGKGGPNAPDEYAAIVVNVWMWPCVVTLWGPAYRPWVSPHRWGFYPVWWKPYRVHPFAWHYQYCAPFRMKCTHVTVVRTNRVHVHYRSYRKTSVHVHTHYRAAHEKRGGVDHRSRKADNNAHDRAKGSGGNDHKAVDKPAKGKAPAEKSAKGGGKGKGSSKSGGKAPAKGGGRK